MTGYNLSHLNVLIVDDNRHMRLLVRSLLHAFGCKNVVEAEEGAAAFREMKHFPADIIITDWVMEPIDGIDFVKLLRTGSDSPNPFVPVIMLTGHTEMRRVIEARDTGVNEFLAKPISAHALFQRIQSIIEKPRPFVKTKRYFGPDRRRKVVTNYKGPERRQLDEETKGGGLSPAEVAALLGEGSGRNFVTF